MHILLVRQHFSPPSAAGSSRPFEMAKRWVAHGHNVTILTSTTKFPTTFHLDSKINTFALEGIDIVAVNVPYKNSFGFFRRLFSFIQFARLCIKASKHIKEVDVVLGSSTPLTVAIPAIQISKRHNCPMVFEVRDLWPEMPIAVGALRNPILKLIATKLEHYAYRNASRIIALSPGMASGVVSCGYPERKVTVIPNASDVERFQNPEIEANVFFKKYPFLKSKKIILYAGTIGKLNGVDYLAEIARESLASNPEVAFVVVGVGGREEVVRRAADRLQVLDKNFFMLGEFSKEDIPIVFKAASICTSLFINIPEMEKNSANKFFDSLAAGKPVLINYAGWQRQLIKQNNIGLFVPPKDPAEASRRLINALDRPELIEDMGVRAGKIGQERFSMNTLSGRALEVLETAVKVHSE